MKSMKHELYEMLGIQITLRTLTQVPIKRVGPNDKRGWIFYVSDRFSQDSMNHKL